MPGLPLLVSAACEYLGIVRRNDFLLEVQEVSVRTGMPKIDLLWLLLQGQDADNGHSVGGTEF